MSYRVNFDGRKIGPLVEREPGSTGETIACQAFQLGGESLPDQYKILRDGKEIDPKKIIGREESSGTLTVEATLSEAEQIDAANRSKDESGTVDLTVVQNLVPG